MAYKTLLYLGPLACSPTFLTSPPPTYSALATSASLLSLNHAKHTPASLTPCHVLFPLSGTFLPQYLFGSLLLPLESLLKWHLIIMTTLHKPACTLPPALLHSLSPYPALFSSRALNDMLFIFLIYLFSLIRISFMRAEVLSVSFIAVSLAPRITSGT